MLDPEWGPRAAEPALLFFFFPEWLLESWASGLACFKKEKR